MPETWYRAMPRADDGTPIAARPSMERYGFRYCNDQASDPIGFVLDKGKTGDVERPAAIGLTCSACHTGHLSDGKATLIVHGGAAAMDLQSFTSDLFTATRKVWSGPFEKAETAPEWQGFAKSVLGDAATAQDRAKLHKELSEWLQYRRDIQASIDDGGVWGHGRQDAVQVILNTVSVLSDSKIRGGLPASTAPVSIPHVWLAPHSERVQWNGSVYKSQDIGIAGSISTSAMIRNISEAIGVFAELQLPSYEALAAGEDLTIKSSIRLDNLIRLERAMAEIPPPRWPEGLWGAIDRTSADHLAGKALYDQHCAACHARVDPKAPFAEIVDASGKPLLNDPTDGAPFVRVVSAFATQGDPGPFVDTDPMMACNAMTHASWSGKMTAFVNLFGSLQSFTTNGILGTKVERFPTGTETLRLIEDMSLRILWDKQAEISAVQKSDVGRQTDSFFAWLTGGDVKPESGDWVIAQAEEVPTPTPVTHALKTVVEVRQTCAQVLAARRLTAPYVPPPAYKAGPLAGIFASAPYLHNGSIPTLDALLLPPEQRPTSFAVGQVLFNPTTLGLGSPVEGGRWSVFSVTDDADNIVPGNSNEGHAFPVNPLSDAERAQLVAYLKGL